jgi:hypothetical protein
MLRLGSLTCDRFSSLETPQHHYNFLQSRDLGYLCSLFKHLVLSVAVGTIYCIINDFYVLEQQPDSASVLRFATKLHEISELCSPEKGSGVVFKTLFMTPVPMCRGKISQRLANETNTLRVEVPTEEDDAELISEEGLRDNLLGSSMVA